MKGKKKRKKRGITQKEDELLIFFSANKTPTLP